MHCTSVDPLVALRPSAVTNYHCYCLQLSLTLKRHLFCKQPIFTDTQRHLFCKQLIALYPGPVSTTATLVTGYLLVSGGETAVARATEFSLCLRPHRGDMEQRQIDTEQEQTDNTS